MPRFFDRGDPAEREQRDLEGKLKAKTDQRVDNVVRLQTAEAKLAEARSNVEALALEADDAALDRALQTRRSAEDKIAALHGAALKINAEISTIETQIEKVIDGRCRIETSAAVAAMADRLAKAQVVHEVAARELEAASKEAGILIPESVGIFRFVTSARTQLPAAVEMVTAALKRHSAAVLSGHAPASLPRPQPAAPTLTVVQPPQEPEMTVLILKNVKYVDQAGKIVTLAGSRRHSLPQHLAQLALAEHMALPLSERQRILDIEYNASAFFVPDQTSCVWLGPKGKEAPPKLMKPGGPAPVHSSFTQFEEYDRGPAYSAVMSRPPPPMGEPLAASGARKAEDGES